MPATAEITVRWCFDCGIDLFLSSNPLVISEEIAVCDVCRRMNRKLSHPDELRYHDEPLWLPSSAPVNELWNRFCRRIRRFDVDDDEDDDEYEGYRGKIRRAEKAIANRDAAALIKEIVAAMRCRHICDRWSRRLRVCLSEAEQLAKSKET